MTSETKIFLGIILTTILIIGGGMVLMTRPAPTYDLKTLAPATAWATGSATPKATLVEFSDYQCPACKAFEPTIESMLAKYATTLRFVYREFPLAQHPFGQKAAIAAEAAGAQGKFWEYHTALFPQQDSFSDEFFVKLATDLGLNVDKFKTDLENKDIKKRVDDDVAFGNTIGISATPTFFLDGKKLNLQNYTDLETAVAGAVK